MSKKQKIYKREPKGQWFLYDIPDETKELVKKYARERGEKIGVCVDRLLKEAIETLPNLKSLYEGNKKAYERLIEVFKEEKESSKPWWRF